MDHLHPVTQRLAQPPGIDQQSAVQVYDYQLCASSPSVLDSKQTSRGKISLSLPVWANCTEGRKEGRKKGKNPSPQEKKKRFSYFTCLLKGGTFLLHAGKTCPFQFRSFKWILLLINSQWYKLRHRRVRFVKRNIKGE